MKRRALRWLLDVTGLRSQRVQPVAQAYYGGRKPPRGVRPGDLWLPGNGKTFQYDGRRWTRLEDDRRPFEGVVSRWAERIMTPSK